MLLSENVLIKFVLKMNIEKFTIHNAEINKKYCAERQNLSKIKQENEERCETKCAAVPKQEPPSGNFFPAPKTETQGLVNFEIREIVKHEKRKKKFKCKLCEEVVQSPERLKEHMTAVHCNNEMKIKCTHCSRKFMNLWNLKNHLRTHSDHSDEKIIPCSICHKIFRDAVSLKLHLKGHFTPKCYSCSDCDIKFQDKRILNNHIQEVHGKKKCNEVKENKNDPYICSYCGKITWKFQLHQRHLITHKPHHDKRPFKCTICTQTFKHSLSFKKHFSVHSKQKLFTCNICNALFAQNNYLVAHMETHIKKE